MQNELEARDERVRGDYRKDWRQEAEPVVPRGDVVTRSEDGGHSAGHAAPVVPRVDVVTRSEDGGHSAGHAAPVVPRGDVVTRSDDGGQLEAVVGQLSQRVTEMDADVQALKTQVTADVQALRTVTTQHTSHIHDARTSTFTRWGSSRCTNTSQLVYSGVVGGSDYGETGAATNYLCLPVSGAGVASDITLSGAAVLLVGAEYETGGLQQNLDPVCSVCRASLSTTIMVPGSNVCASGWSLQYSGYLMAGANTHNAGSEFICVDTSLESWPGSSDDHNGKLLYSTTAQCGSLPCPPYVQDQTVVCAVCSM